MPLFLNKSAASVSSKQAALPYAGTVKVSLDSASARKALIETLAHSQKAIAELQEARQVRPEQLNAPMTMW